MSKGNLTMQERSIIFYLNMTGVKHAEIGRRLGRHRATIGRELRRNVSVFGHYLPDVADHKAVSRRRAPRARPVRGDRALMRYVEDRLKADWSPEQIVGRLREVGDDRVPGRTLSHQTIYHWIWACPDRAARLKPHLRVACKPRRKPYGKPSRRGHIPGRVSIDHRPEVVDQRSRLGDWEADTMVGKGRGAYLATAVERMSRYLVARKVGDSSARSVCEALRRGLRRLPARQRLTLTTDNGREFALHQWLGKRLGLDVYFAHAYSAWERGTNENTNGLLRQYAPKKSDLKGLTESQLSSYVKRLNHRPRKCLNYRTPAEVFWARPVALLI
jgi:IS30 family transposase